MNSDKEEVALHRRMEEKSHVEIDLERALDLCGAGKYQVFHCGLMVAVLGSVVLEMIGCSFIIPAAACDLQLSDNLRGLLTCIPNIGIILTAPLWGRAADALGRKPVLLFSTAISGVFALMAAFMPNLLSFTLCKFASSLFLSCPSSLGFAYAGELIPRQKRDLALLICNAILMLTSSLCPIFAWGILSHRWEASPISVRPWRILTALYAAPVILAAVWVTQAKESPKFLMTKDKQEEALEILKHIFAVNTGYSKDSYCVTSLKSYVDDNEASLSDDHGRGHSSSAWSLLRPPHLKWLALTGFLMFGLFSLLNGLFLFAPSTINKMVTTHEPYTICELLSTSRNKTLSTTCTDNISYGTFQIMVVTSLVYGTIVMLVSLSPLSKKILLVGMFSLVGVSCVVSVLTTNRLVAGVSVSALQVTALGIGPLTAYSVQIFPTALRATAVGAILMLGRVGSVVGANVAGVFLPGSCTGTFYGFSGLLFLCACLSVLLPEKPLTNRVT